MFTFYILALIVVYLGVVIGLPGSIHINPLLLHFYDPYTVTFLTTTLLLLTSSSSVIIFWKQIKWAEAWWLTFYGAIGGIVGGLLFGYLPPRLVVLLFFISGGFFIYSHYKKKKESQTHGLMISGFMTSFLQAFGISAGALRRTYLLSRGLTLQEIYGTIAVAYTASALGIIISRMIHENIPFDALKKILVLYPFIFITVIVGKKTTNLFSKKVQEYIVIYSLLLSLALAIPYLFK